MLVIEFEGRCMIRQPTDPDPYDERRGVSGYTFAFGDEPDLNRVIYFQPHPDFPVRSHCPPIGVTVRQAFMDSVAGQRLIPALRGATVDLLDDPVLENRNWALTRPGFEPILPFHLRIASLTADLVIQRQDPLDPAHPDAPIWQLPRDLLIAKGARGLAYEPSTVGIAIGVYNGYNVAKPRLEALERDREALLAAGEAGPALAVLDGRIYELGQAVAHAEAGIPDRRTGTRQLIERFGFAMSGQPGLVTDESGLLHGRLDVAAATPWRIDFWIGGWDFDALCAYVQGALQIPYKDVQADH